MINNISILKNMSILYVEDEKDLREVTHEILKSFTKNQYIAENGQEGLELFKKYEKNIDLIVTDINMPILNGLEMAKEIKNINPNIPIIITTAFSNKEYLLESIDIGIDKYVLKPIDIAKLLQAMSQSIIYYELKELFIDKLTNLPNRNRLKKDLNQTDDVLMAFFDIDGFLTLNDLFGEEIGDGILVELSYKLKEHFPANEYSVYKLDVDKFVVVAVNSGKSVEEFYKYTKSFINKIENQSFLVNENEIDINLTVGVSHANGALAYKYAQRTITYARTKLRKIMIYNDSFNIHQSFENNIKWLKQLKNGFKENRFQAYFQPIVDTQTKEIYKYEALIRYIDENGNEVGPYNFLDIAKKTKQYPNIIKVILKDALKLIKEKNKKVSINISYADISNKNTTKYIYDFLTAQSIEHTKLLSFEILESEEIVDFEEVSKFISEVKKFECTVGIDDFGAGYSNFHLLSKLKISFIKIDGSLIQNIHNSKDLEIIVRTISNIAKEFNVKTVAEFVANEEIYNKVKELNIDYSQGFYFDKPISYDSIK
ncbi:EAL domain-containing response regulator [Aliarcobacter butzleri]|uniref:REC domain-containing phosphodiesterase n=1 Tax=Aliarcobacter butzleri TaxID=28197 RepID=A0AAW7PNN2_9BACT|nr:REC domain-containing phosphodiesterase [Aliarcobacter butzleri]MCT7600591.1 REC domain-containing phosphodiesterase [Aliarcobacter butzleri]MCT7605034.1 REC domain-containing phosphodiesterase [Aliarcobacter butzleri]MCT7607700.1 REC domain-containing phosphodiesterase [Aliarcobacter butzleri]MDN5062826.1 REC domain-containing phosphodiesterase [Aliarcobacter butzleri]MDN5066889.1 REC domain-containing phosphodiesterase [Aliarcobacter butzleri]